MFDSFEIIDLTQTITPESPSWEGSCGFSLRTALDYDQCQGNARFRVQELELRAGSGTHIDAPSHCYPEGMTTSDYELTELKAPAIVLNIESKAHKNYALSTADVLEFEQQYGKIPKHSIVLIHTGWQRYWNEPKRYRGDLEFPHISEEAARLLIRRDILAIGIDTLSPDKASTDFPVHRLFLGTGRLIIENICHAEKMPPVGGFVLIAPIKIEGLAEAPVRLIGWISKPLSKAMN